MNTVCTIVTADHLALARALNSSIQKHNPGLPLHVLVVDALTETREKDFITHNLSELSSSAYFKGIEKKYAHTNKDSFRWALKPVFIGYLLEQGFDKVLFADSDVFFTAGFDFIFKELDHYNVLLTPHWANTDPTENEDSLLSVLKGGLFNAGFIGCNQQGADAMKWWAGLCHYKTEDNKGLGLFVDQKYLDIMPVQFEKTGVLRHRGCNLASWNIDTSKRSLVNGKVLINEKDEPVFIHFAKDTITNILNRNDVLLKPWLDEYIEILRQNGFELLEKSRLENYQQFESTGYKIKHMSRIRTRLKRMFFKIAEKI